MESTSGAAERALLRGRTREAALEGGGSRKRLAARVSSNSETDGADKAPASRTYSTAKGIELATGGARADRVGAKLPARAIAPEGAGSFLSRGFMHGS
jgi:hypothetical protein